MWVPKKIMHIYNVNANTQGPHVERVPEKKIQYFVGINTKKRSTKYLKKNASKVYNSRKREVAYKKNKEMRHISNPYSTVEERRKPNEYIPHPYFNDKALFTYNEHNGKITWAKVPNR